MQIWKYTNIHVEKYQWEIQYKFIRNIHINIHLYT